VTEPPEHRACREPEQVFTAADLEAARAEGRREANNAITWNTSCIGCAKRLDQMYAERVAGYEEAARFIADELKAAYDASGDPALLDAVAIARRHAGSGPHSPAAATQAQSEGSRVDSPSGGLSDGLPAAVSSPTRTYNGTSTVDRP
jgi:hypothetical protein